MPCRVRERRAFLEENGALFTLTTKPRNDTAVIAFRNAEFRYISSYTIQYRVLTRSYTYFSDYTSEYYVYQRRTRYYRYRQPGPVRDARASRHLVSPDSALRLRRDFSRERVRFGSGRSLTVSVAL